LKESIAGITLICFCLFRPNVWILQIYRLQFNRFNFQHLTIKDICNALQIIHSLFI